MSRRALAIALCLTVARQAGAAEIEYHVGDGSGGYVTIHGDIAAGDADKFRSLATAHELSTVFLVSDGGSIAQAMEIGRIINVSGYRTVVLDGYVCASSCALIWLAGSPRVAQPNSRIGFHASYVLENKKPIPAAVGNAMVGRYLTQLGLPASAVIYATMAGPTEMLWLDTTKPGSEGISYELYRSPTRASASVASAPSRTSTGTQDAGTATLDPYNLNGRAYGSWEAYVDRNIVGAATVSATSQAKLGMFCVNGTTCTYALTLGLKCTSGSSYRVEYQVDGTAERTGMQLTCDKDGDTLFTEDPKSFAREISSRSSVTIYAQDTDSDTSGHRFDMNGYSSAVRALIDANYIRISTR